MSQNKCTEFYPPFIVIPMPLDKDGRGPEMDSSKVFKTVYEVWDAACQTIATYNNMDEAAIKAAELNAKNHS